MSLANRSDKPPEDSRVRASALLAKASKSAAEGDFTRMREFIREAEMALKGVVRHSPHIRKK